MNQLDRIFVVVLLLAPLAGCGTFFPTSGPTKSAIEDAAGGSPGTSVIQIVEVNAEITRRLMAQQERRLFSETLNEGPLTSRTVGRGDVLEVSIWEAAPATLFGIGTQEARGVPSSSRASTFPEQMVDSDGMISVPFAGRIAAAGKSVQNVEQEIVSRLKRKANQPEVLVRVMRNASSNATIVGEVTTSTRMPLTPGNERLLDAIAAAAGVRQPVNKMTIQVTRGEVVQALPLEMIIRDPRQNIYLRPGDVVTALFQPLSFTTLGATGKNEEINFEAQGISLAQALARAGGLIDTRSNPQGVFIFRFEPRAALDWPRQPVATTPDGLVPVIYRINLLDPASFFVMQSFAMNNKDLLYVSNAPANELQKFLNMVFSVAYPVLTAVQVAQ